MNSDVDAIAGSTNGMKEFVRNFVIGAIVMMVTVVSAVVLSDRFRGPTFEITAIQNVEITVSVTGAVASPGVYVLPITARLNDLIEAAGGLTEEANVTSLNLAARIGDGETVRVPASIPATPTGSGSSTGYLININVASSSELDELPGIGPVLAGRIVEYREQFGLFQSVDQLIEVGGISQSVIEELRPLVTVGD